MRILIIGSDDVGAAQLGRSLELSGCNVSTAAHDSAARSMAVSDAIDAIVVHRNGSDESTPAFIASLRAEGVIAVLFAVCDRDATDHAVQLLDAGADGVLDAPYVGVRMAAQIRAVVRRASTTTTESVQVGDLLINRVSHRVSIAGTPLLLTARQYALLEYLALRSGTTVLRSTLIAHVWKLQFDPGSNVVDVHVAQLRKRLRDAGSVTSLRTVRGEGYALDASAD